MFHSLLFQEKGVQNDKDLQNDVEKWYESKAQNHSNIEQVVIDEVTYKEIGLIWTMKFGQFLLILLVLIKHIDNIIIPFEPYLIAVSVRFIAFD